MTTTINRGEPQQLTSVKKVWLNPELTLISSNQVNVKSSPSVREATGHASGYTPNDHAPHPGHHFLNAPSSSSVLNFSDAVS